VTKAIVVCRANPNRAGESDVLHFDKLTGLAAGAGAVCHMPKGFRQAQEAKATGAKVTLELAVADTTIMNAYEARETQDSSDAGFFYREPAQAFVSLSGHPKADMKPTLFVVPQLGKVRSLPRVSGNKPSLTVELYPDTGALKKVTIGHTKADIPGLIGSASTGAGAVLDAAKAKNDAAKAAAEKEAAKNDPLAVLTYEQGLVEAELAVETAKRALSELEEQ
jgi:hypothetical protein